jgi:hypothetical protein
MLKDKTRYEQVPLATVLKLLRKHSQSIKKPKQAKVRDPDLRKADSNR